MYNQKILSDYSELVLKIGVNLQKNQGLEINCPVEFKDFARIMAEKAYELGAKEVRVRWSDDILQKINFQYASIETLSDIPQWLVDSKEDLLNRDFCYVDIYSEDPTIYKDIPAEKIAAYSKAKSIALKHYSDQVMADKIRWCVISLPTLSWAKQVFKDDENAEEKLSNAILETMRLDKPNPLEAWEKHIETLNKRAEFLNEKNFDYIHFEGKNGTNLDVGLADGHFWMSACEQAQDGRYFVANMPTEEIFTAPHCKKINGVVKSALPLAHNGQIVDNFSLTFKDGKVVDFSAEKGYDLLKHIIETDEGTKSLGEIALIGKSSVIASSKILYYNILFDENASCHLAFGKAYPTNVKGGANMTALELEKAGLNDSVDHVDFMIGTPDLLVIGVEKDGKKTVLFENGDWVI